MPVIGLAGGIGAGKSEVARTLAALGCEVSDSDAAAKAMLVEDDIRRTLVSWWGESVYTHAGQPDRAAIGRLVFNDPAQRTRLERLIHPRLKVARDAAIAAARRRGAKAFVIDAPLLFEAGLDSECDAVIFVDAPRAQRVDRVRSARGWDDAELARREAAQWPVEDKRARSGYAVNNSADRTDLERQVRAALESIIHRFRA